jgi:hypothetical protein
MADEKRPKEPEQPNKPEPQKGLDPKRSSRTPETEPPTEKRRDDL